MFRKRSGQTKVRVTNESKLGVSKRQKEKIRTRFQKKENANRGEAEQYLSNHEKRLHPGRVISFCKIKKFLNSNKTNLLRMHKTYGKQEFMNKANGINKILGLLVVLNKGALRP